MARQRVALVQATKHLAVAKDRGHPPGLVLTGAGAAAAARSQDEHACDHGSNYIALQYINARRDFVRHIIVYYIRIFLDTMVMNHLDK